MEGVENWWVIRTGEAERERAMQGMMKTMVVLDTEGDSKLMKLLIVTDGFPCAVSI